MNRTALRAAQLLTTMLVAALLALGLAAGGAAALPQQAHAATKPAKATVSKAAASSSAKVVVAVKKVSKASGYQMRLSTKQTMASAKTKTVKSTKATFTGLSGLTKYWVQARAYKLSKGKKVWGKWSAKKTVMTPCAHPLSAARATVTTAATCTTAGSKQVVCSLCGKVTSNTIVPALGHSLGAYASNGDATCTTDGTKTAVCSRCGFKSTVADTGSATGHEWGKWVEVSSPTCTELGSEKRTCLSCLFTETRNLDAAGHSWAASATVDKAATCTEDGSESVHCTACSAVKNSRVLPALGHDYQATVVPASCTTDGRTDHVCSRCGDSYTDSRIAAYGHSLTHHNAASASCAKAGNAEYWDCSRCGDLFLDSAGTSETTEEDIAIPAAGHKLTYHSAVDATCTAAGSVEYWQCAVCGGYFLDAAGISSTTKEGIVVAAIGHKLTHHAAVNATCTAAGNLEYWECSRCNGLFLNAAGTSATTAEDVAVPATGHSLVHHAAVDATCAAAGNVEYWACSACGGFFLDEAATNATTEAGVAVPATGVHKLTRHAAVDATCVTAGNIEYWDCSACGGMWKTAAASDPVTASEVTIPATGTHIAKHVAGVPATCEAEGTLEHWVCYMCNGVFADAECTKPLDSVVAPISHNVTHYAAVKATCTVPASIEYWECATCGTLFGNAALTVVIDAEDIVTAPALGHNLENVPAAKATCDTPGNIEYWVCTRCGAKYEDEEGYYPLEDGEEATAPSGHKYLNKFTYESTDFWLCDACGKWFTDAEATQPAAAQANALALGITVQSSIDGYSWAELSRISKLITKCETDADVLLTARIFNLVAENGKLTGSKQITLTDGTECAVRILDFRHDDRSDGAGKTGFTFEFQQIVTTHVMNATSTNEGGWRSSAMRSWLNSDFYSLLPEDLQAVIQEVDKATNNTGGSSATTDAVTLTGDKLWLLSSIEIGCGSTTDVYAAEGSEYRFYKENSSLVKYNLSGTADYWWLRSPGASGAPSFCCVNSNGSWYSYYAGYANGVSPGFCL